MNKKLIPLIFIASSSFAQTPVPPASLAFSKAHPVASPNRIPFSAGAVALKNSGVSTNDSEQAVRVIDSKGITLGRYAGSALLLSYNGQPLMVPLQPDFNDTAPTGGLTWQLNNFIYPSADCSGPAYINSSNFGTRYTGWATLESGKYYLHIVDEKQGAVREYNSIYDYLSSTCFYTGSGFVLMTPIQTTIALASLATAPLFLK